MFIHKQRQLETKQVHGPTLASSSGSLPKSQGPHSGCRGEI